MASRESSASEGEIAETTHKANTATIERNGPGIDNSSRGFSRNGASQLDDYNHRHRNRSPSPYRRKRDRSPSPYRRDRHANRSPSPFRHGRGGPAMDHRSSVPHKRKASPERDNRPEKRYNHDRRIHSPSRHPHHETVPPSSHGTDTYRTKDSSMTGHKDVISYAGSGRLGALPRLRDTVSHAKVPARDNKNAHVASQSAFTKTNGSAHAKKIGNTSTEVTGDEQVEIEETVPKQESREEKKRRWAAMRAQHATENSPLLQQALLTNASETTTPNVASPRTTQDSISPPLASPRLPDMDSMPASPMEIDKQGDLSAAASPRADSPSAANYDPTQDMLDDRLRAEQRATNSGLSASAYDETNPRLLSILPAEKTAPVKKQKKKKELDMFAFSDDENEDSDESEVEEEEQIAPAKGTVLDAKLLDNWDDVDGYYKIISNELVNSGRYRMIKGLGRGVFANVAQAEDVQEGSGQLVAIKIVRRNDAMKKASQKEMDFLFRLNEADPQDKRHIVRCFGSFDHKGHLCIVFEHMSKNLRDLLKEETSGHGLSLQAVKTYARQMFSGLKHLQDCQIIHADLKPDNILVSLDKKTIKLCDLGTAADKRDNNEPTPYLVSRFYRAPEIILGMEISYAVDMWAVGCTIYELWTGKILFPGRSNNQMIKVFMECLGWPSEKLLKRGLLSGQHYEAGPPLKLISREVDRFGNPAVRKIEQSRLTSRSLKTRVHEATRGITGNGPSVTDLNDFSELLAATLNWNYEKRIQPKEAINHRFFVKPNLAPRPAVVKPAVVKSTLSKRTFPVRR